MKSTAKKITILLFAVLATGSMFAQNVKPHENPKYGVDSAARMQCITNMSLYKEFYKQQNFNDALGPWRSVYDNCPEASKNTYIHGATIYKNLIAREKDAAAQNALIDSLMMIYDQRIKYYKQEDVVLGYKGADLYSYKGKDAAQTANGYLKKAIELSGKDGKSALISVYMQTVVDMYRAEQIGPDGVINAYTFATNHIEKIKKYNESLVASGNSKKIEEGKEELATIGTVVGNVEALFSESGAANCDALVAIFKPKFAENAQNIDWIKNVTNILNKTECADDPFFAKAAEQQYKLEPSAEAAHNLARLFLKTQEFDKADKYYAEATKLQQDAPTNALYYFEWSTLAYSQQKYSKVRELANKSLELNPNDGRPYIQIGLAYAQSKGIGKEPVEHSAVYWVAVDKFYKAKSIDESVAEQAQQYISTYSKYYPNFEEWFMAVGSKEGDSYTVGGWIGETTKVRF